MDNREPKELREEMLQLLMQSVVDKLEGMEMLLHAALDQKSTIDLSPIIREIASLKKELLPDPARYTNVKNAIEQLSQSVVNLDQKLSVQRDAKIEYKHVLHKGIWLSSGLALLSLLLIAGWVNTNNKLADYKENDIKYRYLKVIGNKWVRQLCEQTDDLYTKDAGAFTGDAVAAEKQLARMADFIRLAVEKRKVRQ